MYRLVREYRDRYPEVVILSPENGAGPIPILMGGGIAQGGGRAGADAAGVELSSDAVIARMVREHLADELMKMHPVDGLVADAAHNWVLAGDATDAVLVYSHANAKVVLAKALPHRSYRGQWIDPVTGAVRAEVAVTGAAGTLEKPDGRAWFLLLRADGE